MITRTFAGPRLAYDAQGFAFDPLTQVSGNDPPAAIVRRNPFAAVRLRPPDPYTAVGHQPIRG